MKKKLSQGFTLIELIIVIAVIALLAAATFVAINPAKRVGDANNARRWSDVTAIADAYQAYLVDNSGTAPTSTTAGITYSITTTTWSGTGYTTCNAAGNGNATPTTAYVELSALVTNGYIGQIPTDPNYDATAVTGDLLNTGYYLYRESTGKLVIGACDTYNTANIEVVR
jgi:prepilin-type N-terminal cleavage/methylation domain-containing protein